MSSSVLQLEQQPTCIEGWVVWAQVCNEGMWQTSHSMTPPLPQWLQQSSLIVAVGSLMC